MQNVFEVAVWQAMAIVSQEFSKPETVHDQTRILPHSTGFEIFVGKGLSSTAAFTHAM